MMMYGFSHMWFGWFFWIAIIILAVWVIATNINKRDSVSSGRQESAMEILKKRLAKGEIDKEEFEKIRKEIEK